VQHIFIAIIRKHITTRQSPVHKAPKPRKINPFPIPPKKQKQAAFQNYLRRSLKNHHFCFSLPASKKERVKIMSQNIKEKGTSSAIAFQAETFSPLQLLHPAPGADHHQRSVLSHLRRKDLSIVESSLARRASEAAFVPLPSKRLNVLTDDGDSALLALWGATLRAFRLAVDAPRIPILFDMCHAVFEWVTALGAEEVAIVPVLA
jgi:hypothetical protein